MALWSDMVSIAMPRNGTTSQTVNPASSGTVAAGTRFTPTAGRLLVICAYGAVTFTTPSGTTLPSGGSAVNNGGLYHWTKTAAGSDTFTSTNNASNYPSLWTFWQFPAGSSFLGVASNSNQPKSAGAGPTLTTSAGTKLYVSTGGQAYGVTTGTPAWSAWGNSAVENVDTFVVQATTDGYSFGSAYIEDSTATSMSVAATITSTETNTVERGLFAVSIPAAATPTRYRQVGKRR